MKQITREQTTMLALLGNILFGRQTVPDGELDWQSVMREADEQAVLPLVYQAAKGYLPAELAEQLAGRVDEILVNDMLLEFEHVELHQIMTEAGVDYVVMKGSASAAYYPDPLLRTMGDVDFLVREEDVARGGEALERHGFRPKKDEGSPIHRAYARSEDPRHDSVWELHWRPNGIPRNEVGQKLAALLHDSLETAVLRETENGAYRVPDDRHHGLMILLHTIRHMLHTGVGARHLCDWAAFVSHFSGTEFRDLFERDFRALGLWETAAALTAVCVRYLSMPDPGWQGHVPDELTEALMGDILEGGNFGSKDEERINASVLYVNSEDGTLGKKGKLSSLFSALSDRARKSFPAVREHPALLPAAWVCVAARHLLRVAQGRRPGLHVGRMLASANDRSALYRKLLIFENEDIE